MENSNIEIKLKKCSKCKEKKLIEFFYKNKSKKDGLTTECKNCLRYCLQTPEKKEQIKKYKRSKKAKKTQNIYDEKRYKTKERKFSCLIHRASILAKKKKIPFDLDKNWINDEWNKQNGQCFFLKMDFNFSSWNPLSPSIDRIDSSKGYTKDNCRLVSWWANAAKNMWNEEEFIEMCRLVAKNFPKE